MSETKKSTRGKDQMILSVAEDVSQCHREGNVPPVAKKPMPMH